MEQGAGKQSKEMERQNSCDKQIRFYPKQNNTQLN